MKISIITINYNNAEGLRKTLASVATQTYPYIQHIIVDGGSTDGSVEIIREYADNQAKGERLEVKGTGNEVKGERLEVKGEENGEADTPASTLYTLHSTPTEISTTIYTNLHNSTPPTHTVCWISEKDTGIYNAMNKGLEIALGKRIVNDDHTSAPIANSQSPIAQTDYIQILNAGDILAASDVTERMMAALAAQYAEAKGNEEVKGYRLEVKGSENGEADTQASHLSPLASRLISDSDTASRLSPLASHLENCPTIFYGNMIKEYPDGKRIVDKCLGDRNKSKLHIREIEWTMYDFIRGTINHDPTYIHRSLYEKYGLYDDNLKIVSDWKWFVNAVVFNNEKVFYIPINVTIFDMTGISETNLMEREKERHDELEKMLPLAILKDYDTLHFPISQYRRLKRYRIWSLVYFVERILFKFEKWGILAK